MVLFGLLLLPILLLLLLLLLYFIVRPRPINIPIKNRHLAIAKQAASEGARISLLARSVDQLQKAKESICQAYEVEVSIFSADVRDYDAVERAIKEAGPIDVLVVNHGVYYVEEFETQGLDVMKTMIDVNLMGSFNVIKAALPLMKDKKDKGPASIALMSSMAGQGVKRACTIFPPVTETSGIEQAREKMPEITKIILESSPGMKAEEVGKITIQGIKSGSFSIPCRLDGQAVAIATAGLSPQTSFLMASIEVVFAGLFRFLALLLQWRGYEIIEKYNYSHKKQQVE
ncbi:hypothetical protein V6Z11_A05G244900 [Gossypium hirsutum]